MDAINRIALPGAPRCVINIVVMEAMERFAFYGFRAILTLYLIDRLGFSESAAVSIFAFSSALSYTSPLLGGWLADAAIGKYSTILWLGCVYAIGMWALVLSAARTSTVGSLVSLVLIGIGTGGIKPCVSSFGADQFGRDGEAENDNPAVRRYFAVFYASINVGSVVSFIVTPIIRGQCGYSAAFALPAALMACALIAFRSAASDYVVLRPRDLQANSCSTVVEIFERSKSPSPDVVSLRRVLGVLSTLPVFWMLYDQQGSVWVMQANDMGRFGGRIQPEQLGVVNPILILLLLPFFEKVVYPRLAVEFGNRAVPPTFRMAAGMVFAAASFFVAAIVEAALPLNILWQLPQMFLISVAEILVSVTGLEYSYTQAPAKFKSTVTSAYLLTVAVGDICGGALYASFGDRTSRATLMLVCAILMLANLVLFAKVANSLTGQTLFGPVHTTEDDDMYQGRRTNSLQLVGSQTAGTPTRETTMSVDSNPLFAPPMTAGPSPLSATSIAMV